MLESVCCSHSSSCALNGQNLAPARRRRPSGRRAGRMDCTSGGGIIRIPSLDPNRRFVHSQLSTSTERLDLGGRPRCVRSAARLSQHCRSIGAGMLAWSGGLKAASGEVGAQRPERGTAHGAKATADARENSVRLYSSWDHVDEWRRSMCRGNGADALWAGRSCCRLRTGTVLGCGHRQRPVGCKPFRLEATRKTA